MVTHCALLAGLQVVTLATLTHKQALPVWRQRESIGALQAESIQQLQVGLSAIHRQPVDALHAQIFVALIIKVGCIVEALLLQVRINRICEVEVLPRRVQHDVIRAIEAYPAEMRCQGGDLPCLQVQPGDCMGAMLADVRGVRAGMVDHDAVGARLGHPGQVSGRCTAGAAPEHAAARVLVISVDAVVDGVTVEDDAAPFLRAFKPRRPWRSHHLLRRPAGEDCIPGCLVAHYPLRAASDAADWESQLTQQQREKPENGWPKYHPRQQRSGAAGPRLEAVYMRRCDLRRRTEFWCVWACGTWQTGGHNLSRRRLRHGVIQLAALPAPAAA
mmetsp:Transcript_3306/g.8323  ORF Transcript_3306/g.8323 Transcript_3306/m.8323 type:complete len:330 (-) Transcript_3306:98-1087(-)